MDWLMRSTELSHLAECQLFFVGGAPRSGTTWLQQILDHHPDVSCSGEGLFLQELAVPIERIIAHRSRVLDEKNSTLFRHSGGYPLPQREDVEFMIGAAILLALQQQCCGRSYVAVGEKTPENVFLFPRLKRLFPAAKFIGIARDPRDVLASAWHFFRRSPGMEDDTSAKMSFIQSALSPISNGARSMIAIADSYPEDSMIITYEVLQRSPRQIVSSLFRFLGVSDNIAIIDECLSRTAFSAQTGGRDAGTEQNGNFFRKGVVGDWPSTFTPDMSSLILQNLGWMFRRFGWSA